MVDKKCPACGGELVAVPPSTRSDSTSWVMFIAGIFLTPVLIGIVLIILAVSRGFNIQTDAYYNCLSCHWNNLSYTWKVSTAGNGSKIFQPTGTTGKPAGLIIFVLVIVVVIVIFCVACAILGGLTPQT